MNFNQKLDKKIESLNSTKKFFFSKIIPLTIFCLFLIIFSIILINMEELSIASILSFISILLLTITYKLAINKEGKITNLKEASFAETYSKVNKNIGFHAKMLTIFFIVTLAIVLFIAVQIEGPQILFREEFPSQLMDVLTGIGTFGLLVTLFYAIFFSLNLITNILDYQKKLEKIQKDIQRNKKELKKTGLS